MENTSEHIYIIKAYTKSELRIAYGVSRETLNKWLKAIEYLLPHYTPTAKVLTPAQIKVVFEELGTPTEKMEDRKTIVKKR
jgi:hypothetical protein